MIRTSITCAFNGFLCTVEILQFFKLMKSVTDVFAQKKFSKDVFNSEIYYGYD